MHEPFSGIGYHQLADAVLYLRIVIRSKGLHHDAHRPDDLHAYVRTAYTLPGHAAEEIRIVPAPDETPRIDVDRVVGKGFIKICHGKQRRDIGVIHKILVSVTVHFESIYLSVFRMVINGVIPQTSLHLRGQIKTFLCHGIVSAYLGKYFRSLAQRTCGHEIGRHQKLKGSRIVRRTERRSYQSSITGRIAVPYNAFRIELPVRHPQEPVFSVTVAPLLFAHNLQHLSDCLFPRTVEY